MNNDLERVTARAVECGWSVWELGIGTTYCFTPDQLLAFEQATLKEANATIEQLTEKLASQSARAFKGEQPYLTSEILMKLRTRRAELGG